ncbi:MAG: AAA family ATPase [Pirellulaceae bacterium]|nr:AAA family ATPase [Pirellulaceae bacterium]
MLKDQLWEYIRAGFSGLWIQTHETSEALLEITELAQQKKLQLVRWNLDQGTQLLNGQLTVQSNHDPLSVVRSLGSIESSENNTLLVLENFHRFIESAEICQALLTQLQLGKQSGRHIVILSPLLKIPHELDRQFAVLEYALPDREQLWQIATGLIQDIEDYSDQERESLLDASAGLTRGEAESAYSLSLVRHGRIVDSEIWGLKTKWLRKSGLLSLYQSDQGFDSLGGLDNLKQFCRHSLRRHGDADRRARPRGIMLLGVPGTGKSAFAKALGKESDRPVLMLDIGQLMGSLVGQSEANIRTALKIADAMAPCILFIDEVEKALAGAGSASAGDSGVSSRLFGTLLTWLNDHHSDVYVVVTCNNIQHLPPEFSRAERFDAVLFLDLPGAEEKELIWQLYVQHYHLDASLQRPADQHWTGAEIKACCRLASLLSVSLQEAGQYIVPVGVTAAENIERLRTWASGRCLDASRPGIFQSRAAESHSGNAKPQPGSRPRRGITLRPSEN